MSQRNWLSVTVMTVDGDTLERYDGDWADGQRCGGGTLTTNCFEYDGDFVHGLRHGRGRCNWYQHGVSYDGSWASDRMHGFGTLRLKVGDKVVEAKWEEGRVVGDAVTVSASGERQRIRLEFVVPT